MAETHLDKLKQNTEMRSKIVLNKDPFVFRGPAVSPVSTASPGGNPSAGLPLLPALLHPAHLRAARGAPQEPPHLLISIIYAQVGPIVGGARFLRVHVNNPGLSGDVWLICSSRYSENYKRN